MWKDGVFEHRCKHWSRPPYQTASACLHSNAPPHQLRCTLNGSDNNYHIYFQMQHFWIETVKIRTIKRMCQICSPIGKFLILQYWHYIISLQNEKWGGKGHIRRIMISSTMKTDCKQSERCSGNLRGAQIEAMSIEQGAHGQCWLQMQMLCPPFKWTQFKSVGPHWYKYKYKYKYFVPNSNELNYVGTIQIRSPS